jgi:hypothetical protein
VVTGNLSPQPEEKLWFDTPTTISGYRDAAAELQAEKRFFAVPFQNKVRLS